MSEEISREEIAALLARESEEMTNEEAIEVLQQDIPCEHDTDLIEAIDMAIKALEQEPFMNKPCISEGVCHDSAVQMLDNAISRTFAMETFAHWAEHKDYTHVEHHILHAVVDELRAMPSISEQPDEWTPILKDLYNGLEEGS